jgi:hypothetical protein
MMKHHFRQHTRDQHSDPGATRKVLPSSIRNQSQFTGLMFIGHRKVLFR